MIGDVEDLRDAGEADAVRQVEVFRDADVNAMQRQATQRIARRRLSAKLRPLMLRRLKRQVAQDLPERIEVRREKRAPAAA